ncbi:putative 4-hydroxybenzoyl-CoA reductase, alpha subunit [delta proteobacterium NaphS2]|nr:putative 4-hydroxybenzoyl-CoA reductase, alpha subunit [delta proteobacterium NaphS2]
MNSESYAYIGRKQPQIDGLAKATGEAKFTTDLVLPRMLIGKLLGSPYPHARVRNVDASRALALKGVKAVVTGKDVPGKKYGVFVSRMDETGLTVKARFVGDPVAAVAAVDEETAMEALGLISVDYEILPAVFDPEEAMKEGAPVIHDEYERNIVADTHYDFGDVEAGFRECDHIREDNFFSQTVSHATLEPRGVLADCDVAGKLTLWTSTQAPFQVRRDIIRALDIPASKLRVIKAHVGGGFGGKADTYPMQVAATLLAMKTGRPLKIIATREEEINVRRRAPMSIFTKTGVKKDGAIMAQYLKILADSGAYSSTSILMMYNSGLTCMIPYRIPNFKYDGYQIYTNKMVTGAMRGHGANQPRFAVESQLDMIAEDIGMDPADLRLRNASQKGDTTVSGLHFVSCELSRSIEESTRNVGWKEKRRQKGTNRGIGIACGGFVCGARISGHTASGTNIHVHEDGGVTVITGSADIGQGSNSVMAQFVAEELGIPLSDISVIAADTETTPIDNGTFSSRVTFYGGNATLLAAREVKQMMAGIAATLLKSNAEDIVFRDKLVFVRDDPSRSIPFGKLAKATEGMGHGRLIIGQGQWAPTNTQFPDKKTKWGNVSGSYSFATQIAEVEVDTETGQVKVISITIGDDCGQVINPLSVQGQADGSVAMGIGHALLEQLLFGSNGQLMNPSLLDFKIPTAMECPPTTLLEVGTPDPIGPYGAKEIGEGLLITTVPAICNAIYNAVGVRITELPITPEKILKALDEKKRREKP